jgi:hypothetical protein
MSKHSIQKFEAFLETHARPVDVALYNYYFHDGDSADVVRELSRFQNDDGGFGHAIEPDVWLPQSTALATWMAFQYIKSIDVDAQDNRVGRGLQYFLDTYNPQRIGWAIMRPEVNNHPHAPWWDYETAMNHFGWGNPSAEILGLLIYYCVDATHIIGALITRALERIRAVDGSSFHEVLNFKALYELVDSGLQEQLKDPLNDLIKDATSTDPNEWTSYVATPLRFIETPDDAFASLFPETLIQQNLDFLLQQIVDNDHWEPNWSWAGNYPEQWAVAKIQWSGHLTVRNLRILKNFGQI